MVVEERGVVCGGGELAQGAGEGGEGQGGGGGEIGHW